MCRSCNFLWSHVSLFHIPAPGVGYIPLASRGARLDFVEFGRCGASQDPTEVWLFFAPFGLAWLGLAWLGLARLVLAWLSSA